MKILVSACLLGLPCRYDGKSKPCAAALEAVRQGYSLIPVCPELFGGLATPRDPAERQGERVIARSGRDVTAEYERGARETLHLAQLYGAKRALLKENSPSCGMGRIYDGTFTGTLTDGLGVTAQLLTENGIEVFGESRVKACLEPDSPEDTANTHC